MQLGALLEMYQRYNKEIPLGEHILHPKPLEVAHGVICKFFVEERGIAISDTEAYEMSKQFRTVVEMLGIELPEPTEPYADLVFPKITTCHCYEPHEVDKPKAGPCVMSPRHDGRHVDEQGRSWANDPTMPWHGIPKPVVLAGADVHTEHCCVEHGCKYGDDGCTVVALRKKQSGPCERCEQPDSNPMHGMGYGRNDED